MRSILIRQEYELNTILCQKVYKVLLCLLVFLSIKEKVNVADFFEMVYDSFMVPL